MKTMNSLDYEGMFKRLNIEVFKTGNMLVGKCPVHDGDNENAFNITIDGEYEGNWFCNTRFCHEDNYGIKGLVRAILLKTNKNVTNKDIYKAIGGKISLSEQDYYSILSEEYTPISSDSKNHNLPSLIPSKYYISRGFSKEILSEFEVGDVYKYPHEMYGRSVFPVYSMNNEYIGCVGRSIKEGYQKWKNSSGFHKSQTLYGLWKTAENISNSGSIILVEGQGDFLKLYESGVDNCAGMFSNFLCNEHIKLLLYLGVHTITVLRDNDEAGRIGLEKIKRKVGDIFHINSPKYSHKDIGELTIQQIQKEIIPKL